MSVVMLGIILVFLSGSCICASMLIEQGHINITPNRCTKGEVMEYDDAKYVCQKVEEKVWVKP